MITVMDWLTILVAVISGSVSAGGAIWGTRIRIQSLEKNINKMEEAHSKAIGAMIEAHRHDVERLEKEAQECRERIDHLLTFLVGKDRKDANHL